MGFSGFAPVQPHGYMVLSGTYASVSDKRWYISPAACGSLPRVDYGAHDIARYGRPYAALALYWTATRRLPVSG
jgi:hypothetical protein